MAKRFMPRAMGRATMIQKKSSHVLLVLEESEKTKSPRFKILKFKKIKKEKMERRKEEKIIKILEERIKDVNAIEIMTSILKSKDIDTVNNIDIRNLLLATVVMIEKNGDKNTR